MEQENGGSGSRLHLYTGAHLVTYVPGRLKPKDLENLGQSWLVESLQH